MIAGWGGEIAPPVPVASAPQTSPVVMATAARRAILLEIISHLTCRRNVRVRPAPWRPPIYGQRSLPVHCAWSDPNPPKRPVPSASIVARYGEHAEYAGPKKTSSRVRPVTGHLR